MNDFFRRGKIPKFVSENITFLGAELFEYDNRCLLYENTGHILLCDKELATQLVNGIIPDSLFFKLSQRNFISVRKDDESSCCEKMVRPEFFMIDMTNRCNMGCKYCLRDVKNGGETIEYNVLNDICRYITHYCDSENLKHITIQPWGGEPMLEYEKVLFMRENIVPRNTQVHFSLETNGTLLNEKKVQKLYDNKISVSVSFDGIQDVHDKQRVFHNGSGSFMQTLRGIKLIQKYYGNHFGNIVTITRNSIDYIEDILEYAAVDLNLRHVKFNYVHRSDFFDCDELCLANEDISKVELRILEKLIELHKRGFQLMDTNIKTKLENLLILKNSDICLSRGCNGGRKMIVFDKHGNIFPCELTDYPDEKLGSIYSNISLSDIVQKSLGNNYFMEKKADKCNNCPWYIYCRGGCTINVKSAGKTPPEIDETECSINEELYPALIKLILRNPQVINCMIGIKVLDENI